MAVGPPDHALEGIGGACVVVMAVLGCHGIERARRFTFWGKRCEGGQWNCGEIRRKRRARSFSQRCSELCLP